MAAPKNLKLDPAKARYLSTGLSGVDGWLIPSTALYLAGIETFQRGSVAGGICEIGVHRGKSFLAMGIDAPAEDDQVAIDVFDLQDLNEDGTSKGAKQAFENHLAEWQVTGVDVVQGSSLELAANGFLDGGRRFRLFSVDGGHGAKYVHNDLDLAEATIVTGGIVAADDVFNTHWLGVCTGFFDYLHAGGKLRPYALIPNKVLMTDAASLERNRAQLREVFGDGLSKAGVEFVGGEIDVYADIDWTILDTAGHEATLQRPANDLASVRAELNGAKFELARVQLDLRREKSHNSGLRKQLKAERDKSALGSLKRLGRRLPPSLQGPARAVYSKLRAVAGSKR